MVAKVPSKALQQQLFAVPEAAVYAVLDGASVPNLPQALQQHEAESECLYRGELSPALAQVAPYLVALKPDLPFTERILSEGWGNHWGVFAVSKADFRTLRKHFRTFLKVYDPDGKPLYFRYYDPRVLRVYLPTCNPQETRTMFGPVLRYIAEGEDPVTLLRFWSDDDQPKSEQVTLL